MGISLQKNIKGLLVLGTWSKSKIFANSFQENLEIESLFKSKITAWEKLNVVTKRKKYFYNLGLYICQHFSLLNLFLIQALVILVRFFCTKFNTTAVPVKHDYWDPSAVFTTFKIRHSS